MKRRKFLGLSSITALSLLAGTKKAYSATALNQELPIPTLMTPTDINGIKHYNLTIQATQHTFYQGILTDTWAMNGTYLAPTLLLTNGDSVSINYSNTLAVPTTMHGHGMHLPARMDGTAHQSIATGTTWSAQYRVNQKACTNWYHPHYMHKTAPHVYQGLAGMIIIQDSESQALNIPKRYGIDDIPLVLQDRFFSADKTVLDYSPSRFQINRGYIGDTFIANGAIEPTFNAEAKEIRFRLLNGSNSSVYDLGFSNAQAFKQIASDNAFLEAPVSMSRVVLSPGERAEIVIDFSNSRGSTLTLHEYKNNKTFLNINVNKTATASTSVPSRLTTLDPIDTTSVKTTRPFLLGMSNGTFTINGKAMDMSRIDEVVPLGETEIWEVTNNMGMDHNFHIHATHFRVIERNGSALNVLENEKGYKDVVYLQGNDRVKLLVKMTDYSDETVPYMYHCHFLEHEDNGMMGQFTVKDTRKNISKPNKRTDFLPAIYSLFL